MMVSQRYIPFLILMKAVALLGTFAILKQIEHAKSLDCSMSTWAIGCPIRKK